MNINIIPICALGVFAVVVSTPLRKHTSEIASLILISCGIIISLMYLPAIESLLASINSLTAEAGIKSEYIRILIKSLGICYITQISVNICRENGSMSVASHIEIAGKVLVLLPALPVLNDIIKMLSGFIGRA